MTRIAIVGLNAYPAVNPQASKNVGGLENFAWTFARSLASDPRWQVSLLLRHHRSIPEESLDGVKFVKYIEPLRNIRLHVGRCVRRQEQFPFLKVQIWNWSLLWKIPLLAIVKLLRLKIPHQERLMAMLIESECDVVVALGINADSAAAIHAAKVLGKRVWLWLRSNGDIDERFFADDTFIDPYAVTSQDCRYCVSQVKGILCQTQSQRDRLKEVANRDGVIVRNPVDLARFRLPLASFEERDRVLWLGRMDRFHKRPLLAIEIARQCPDITFEIIANRGDAAVEAEHGEVLDQLRGFLDRIHPLKPRQPELKSKRTELVMSALGLRHEPHFEKADHVGMCLPCRHVDRKSTRLNSSHIPLSRMPSSA